MGRSRGVLESPTHCARVVGTVHKVRIEMETYPSVPENSKRQIDADFGQASDGRGGPRHRLRGGDRDARGREPGRHAPARRPERRARHPRERPASTTTPVYRYSDFRFVPKVTRERSRGHTYSNERSLHLYTRRRLTLISQNPTRTFNGIIPGAGVTDMRSNRGAREVGGGVEQRKKN